MKKLSTRKTQQLLDSHEARFNTAQEGSEMKTLATIAAAMLLTTGLFAAGQSTDDSPKKGDCPQIDKVQGAIETLQSMEEDYQPTEQNRGREYENLGDGDSFQEGSQVHDGSGDGLGH